MAVEWGDPKLLKQFADLGIKIEDGELRVPKDLYEQIEERARERARTVTLPSVPGTPPQVQRDMGLAVNRGAHRPAQSLQGLRETRYRGLIYRPIHSARHYQVRRMSKKWTGRKTDVGIYVAHKDHHDRNVEPPEGFDRYVKAFEKVLFRPLGGDNTTTLGDHLVRLWEDYATINRPVVEPRGSLVDPSSITQWDVVDGALIWPTLFYAEVWWAKNAHLAPSMGISRGRITTQDRIEALSLRLGMDLVGAEYVCVQDGTPLNVYHRGDLLVAPRHNTTDVNFAGYPPSLVEDAIELARMHADSIDFTAIQLSKGSWANQMIGLPWDLSQQAFDAFVDMFRESSQGVRNAGQPLFLPMPPGQDQQLRVVPLAQPINEMGFQAFISVVMSLATAVYRMHPSTINVRPWEGSSGHSLNQGSQTEEIGLAQEEGLQGDMGYLIEAILDPLAMRCHPDLRVFAYYADYDAQKEAAVITTRTQTEMTLNEARLEQGKRPIGAWLSDAEYVAASAAAKKAHDDNVYNHIAPIAMAKLQAQQQKDSMEAQQKMMQQQGGQQPQGGQGGGDDPGDDGGGDDDAYDAGDGYGPRDAEGFDPYQPLGKAAPDRVVTVHLHRPPRRRSSR